jgi:hypothetical protein
MAKKKHHKKHRGMRGFGALKMSNPLPILLPLLVGGGLTAITVAAARYFTSPTLDASGQPTAAQTDTQKSVFKFAPWIGLAVGALSSIAMFAITKGMAGAISTFGSSAVVAISSFAQDQLLASSPGRAALAVSAMAPAAAMTHGVGSIYALRTGAVVPTLGQGTGAVVLTPQGMQGPYVGGERVSLQGVNPSAFGTPAVSN